MDMAQVSEMMHQALEILLTQAAQTEGQLGSVNLAVRFDSRVGEHVHASATVRQRLHVTVDRSDRKK
jgi:hypothetical protein